MAFLVTSQCLGEKHVTVAFVSLVPRPHHMVTEYNPAAASIEKEMCSTWVEMLVTLELLQNCIPFSILKGTLWHI